jgi:hypothetical protein
MNNIRRRAAAVIACWAGLLAVFATLSEPISRSLRISHHSVILAVILGEGILCGFLIGIVRAKNRAS